MTDLGVYLDYNAAVPVRPAAAAAVQDALSGAGNPSSVHRFGTLARRRIEDARETVADLVGAAPRHVVFTSGGTEANNLALLGGPWRSLVISAVEHDSVQAAADRSERDVTRIAVDHDGVVDLAALREILAVIERPALVSVMLVNNETGVIQPVAEVADVAREFGAQVHCDAIQAAGRLTIDMAAIGADLLTLSAHKIGGPQGVGALVVTDAVELAAQIVGGGQELRRRAGTENTAGIAGFGAAVRSLGDDLADVAKWRDLRARIEARLTAQPGIAILGAGAVRVANTVCVAMPGVPSETQVMALDLDGVAVSAGAACSSGKVGPSRVLAAMGVDRGLADCAIRVSFGWQTKDSDLDRFFESWWSLYRRTRGTERNEARPAA